LVRRYLRALAGDWSRLDIIVLDARPGTMRLVADGYRVLFRFHETDARTLVVTRIRPRASGYEGFARRARD